MRRGARFVLVGLVAGGALGCWNRIEVHPAPSAAEPATPVETRVLGWSEEPAGPASRAGVVAHVEDGERTYHVLVGEDDRGRPWSAAFSLDE